MTSAFKMPRRWRQTVVTLMVNLLSLHLGATLGLVMVTNKLHQDCLIFMQRTSDENLQRIDLAQKILVFCTVAATPSAYYIGDQFGRKKALAVSAILFIIACALCSDVDISRIDMKIVSAMIICGVGCAFQVCHVTLYVEEISSSDRREVHSTVQMLAMAVGIYFTFFKPELLKTFTDVIINPLVPVVFLTGLQILPESPVWLRRKGKIRAAEKARDWFQIEDKSTIHPETLDIDEELKNSGKNNKKFIDTHKSFELRKGYGLTGILLHANLLILHCLLISIVKSKIDHWILDVIWIAIITFMIYLHKYGIMKWERESRMGRIYLMYDCIEAVIFICLADVCQLLLKIINTNASPSIIVMFMFILAKSIFYSKTIGVASSVFAVELIPENIPSGVYVFFMTGFWVISWILIETWWWMKSTSDINCWSFVYTFIFVFLLIYVYFFVPQRHNSAASCNEKNSLDAKKSSIIPDGDIFSENTEDISSCTKTAERT